MPRPQLNLLSFGAAGVFYYPFEHLTAAESLTSRVDTRTTKLSATDGGYDEFRNGRAPIAVTRVTCQLHLVTDATRDLTTLRDEVAQIINWGIQPLLYAPYDTQPVRYMFARCVSVTFDEDAEGGTEWMQPVNLTFEAADPRWYSHPNLFWIGQPRAIGETGLNIAAGRTGDSGIQANYEIIETYNGKRPTPVTFVFSASNDGAPVGGVIGITHRDDQGRLLNQISYDINHGGPDLEYNEYITIDSETRSVIDSRYFTEPITGYPYFTILHGSGFIWLQPGVNVIGFTGSIFTDDISVSIFYNDIWP